MSEQDLTEIEDQINSLIEQREFPEALKLAKKYVDEQPDNAEAYYWLSCSKSSWNQNEEAVIEMKNAIAIDPSIAKYYNILGTFYLGLSRYQEALSEYERAVHIEPDNLRYITNLSKAKIYLDDVEGALNDVEALHRAHSDDESVTDNLAEIYLQVAHMKWHFSEKEQGYYATTHEHINIAEEYVDKIKSLSCSDQQINKSLMNIEKDIKAAKKRTYTGGWGTLILALWFASMMYTTGSTIGYLFCISGLLYFFALRTPQYITNKIHFSTKNNLGIADRISSLFVTDGMTFYGRGMMNVYSNMAKTAILMAIIRTVIKLALLPLTVIIAIHKNYIKPQAFIFIGGMVGFVIVMNMFDVATQMSRDSSRDVMIEAVQDGNIASLTAEINDYPNVYGTNANNLMNSAIAAGNLKILDFMLTKTQNSARRYSDTLLNTAINANQQEIIDYLSTGLFKASHTTIRTAISEKGPYRGSYDKKVMYLVVTSSNDDSFSGFVEYSADNTGKMAKSSVKVSGKIIANRVTLSDGEILTGIPQHIGCTYNLRLHVQNKSISGQRVCSDSNQAQSVNINIGSVTQIR